MPYIDMPIPGTAMYAGSRTTIRLSTGFGLAIIVFISRCCRIRCWYYACYAVVTPTKIGDAVQVRALPLGVGP